MEEKIAAVEKVAIEQLKPAPYNPRLMKPAMLEKLKNSIKRFKVYEPLIANKTTGHVIGGNQRLKVLGELGFKKVAVMWVKISLQEEMSLNIGLNRISGEFEEPSLAAIFRELQKIPELLEFTGFTLPEIFRSIELNTEYNDEDLETDKSSFEKTITKKGDLIELGPHKILCGDTAVKENLERLLGKLHIVVAHMDWPYGIKLDVLNRPMDELQRRRKKGWKMIENDDLVGEEYLAWFRKVLVVLKGFLAEAAAFYFWSGYRNFGGMTRVLADEGFYTANVISWVKNLACPGYGDYKFATEFMLYGWLKGKGKHRWYGPPNETNVWKVDRILADSRLHPTAKPVELARRVLRNSTQKGDVLFDGCAGACCNLIGCEQMGRIFRGVEIEPSYVDTAVFRYIRMFGVNSVSREIKDKYLGGMKNDKK